VTLSIGEVAAASGLRPSALRYYEQVGLIAPAERRSGRRHYDPEVLRRLAFIALCQDAGISIAEIATLLDDRSDPRRQWEHLAQRKLEEIQDQMKKLRQMRRHLQSALACECGGVDSCELVDAALSKRQLPLHAGPGR
jgi:MerR family redox-sensitive transcriptional activator SoxR